MIKYRKARMEDCVDLFNWRKDKVTRVNSRRTWILPLEDLIELVENPNKDLFILLNQDRKFGVVQFDKVTGENYVEIGIIIAPNERRKGYSSKAINLLSSYYLNEHDLDYIFAEIKKKNHYSIKSFIKAGYTFYKNSQDYVEYRFK